jgi:hypothetical protein
VRQGGEHGQGEVLRRGPGVRDHRQVVGPCHQRIHPQRRPAARAAVEGSGRPLGRGPVLTDHEQQHGQPKLRLEIGNVVRPTRLFTCDLARLRLDGEQKILPVGRADAQHGVHTPLQRPGLRHVGRDGVHGRLRGQRDTQHLEHGPQDLGPLLKDPVHALVS